MVGVSASGVSSGTGSPKWSRKKGCKMVVVVWWYVHSLQHKILFDFDAYMGEIQSRVSLGFRILARSWSVFPEIAWNPEIHQEPLGICSTELLRDECHCN